MRTNPGPIRRGLVGITVLLTAVATALITSPTAQAQPFPDREIVAVTGTDGQLWVRGLGNDQWAPLGGRLIDAPAVVRTADDVYFFGLGADRNVWVRTPSQSWQPFGPAGTYCTGPGAFFLGSQFGVACLGRDGAAWLATSSFNTPTPVGLPTAASWRSLGGVIKYGTAVTEISGPRRPNEFAIFAVGADDTVWRYTDWDGWQLINSNVCGGPVAAFFNAASMGFLLACRGQDGQLRLISRFTAGPDLLGGQIRGRPGIAVHPDGSNHFFALGLDDFVWMTGDRGGTQDPWIRLSAAGRHGLSAVGPVV